ncbi:hypothetical protein ACFVVU_31165 [Kitasatospora sp. NPDC057965]|uniref:hypothetical protein n=1 Tax=Kitasatospora sp. NPDC057965 TaxID=3346291 RepID=UPI0036DA278E
MRPSRRTWAVLAGVLVLALGAGGFAAWRYTGLFLPDRLCDGAVATGDVRAVLGGGRLEVVRSERSTDRERPEGSCVIEARDGADLTLRTHGVKVADRRSQVDPGMSQPDRGPIGAFANDTGWLVLPAGCRKPADGASEDFPDRDADVLSADVRHRGEGGVRRQDDPAGEAPDQPTREALARLAGDFGSAVAASSGCGAADAPDMHLTAAGPAAGPATDGRLCGLPGVGTGKDLPELAQRVSDPAAPLQSCWIYSGTMAEPAIRFTTTAETRYPAFAAGREELTAPLPAGWRGTGSYSAVHAPCGKDDLFLQLAGRGDLVDPVDPAGYGTPLFTSWANAVAVQRGCEPIAPR